MIKNVYSLTNFNFLKNTISILDNHDCLKRIIYDLDLGLIEKNDIIIKFNNDDLSNIPINKTIVLVVSINDNYSKYIDLENNIILLLVEEINVYIDNDIYDIYERMHFNNPKLVNSIYKNKNSVLHITNNIITINCIELLYFEQLLSFINAIKN